MQREVAFNTVKPNFHEDVNKYEADYKFSEWKRNFLEKYDLEMSEDMIPMYVDKENKFKTGKVEDLIKQDKTLQELTMGRQQKGTGSRQQEIENVEGVPFSIPKDADSNQISKSIKEYLATKNMVPTTVGYSDKFKELHQKIMQKTAV
jgi:phage anti-repressor protein